MEQTEHLLRAEIGLNAASLGRGAIERSIRQRMRATGAERVEDYEQLLRNSRDEWNELIESVVVTETWFFRGPESFGTFIRLVKEEWMPAHRRDCLRVLSVPCASGEEPYSIAIALLDAGLPPSRMHIEGLDISARALERAEAGVYTANSFRGGERDFRERHFHRVGRSYALDAAVRRRVCFQRANLLARDFMLGRGGYDFVFCRNLMIYFDEASRERAFARLRALLVPGGFLFVGSAELPLAAANGFALLKIPMSFACRLADEVRHSGTDGAAKNLASMPEMPPFENGVRRTSVEPGVCHRTETTVAEKSELELARELADRGRLRESAHLCHLHLRTHGVSAEAYYLLGLVHDAARNPEAVDCYRKAVYLDPAHYGALSQLALWSRTQGRQAQALAFRRRAERVRPLHAGNWFNGVAPTSAAAPQASNARESLQR
jgi:chemotaxis protein methyltransferase WspC